MTATCYPTILIISTLCTFISRFANPFNCSLFPCCLSLLISHSLPPLTTSFILSIYPLEFPFPLHPSRGEIQPLHIPALSLSLPLSRQYILPTPPPASRSIMLAVSILPHRLPILLPHSNRTPHPRTHTPQTAPPSQRLRNGTRLRCNSPLCFRLSHVHFSLYRAPPPLSLSPALSLFPL